MYQRYFSILTVTYLIGVHDASLTTLAESPGTHPPPKRMHV